MSATVEIASPPPMEADEEELQWRKLGRVGVAYARLRGNYQLYAGGAILGAFLVVAVYALVRFAGGIQILQQSIPLENTLDPPGPSLQHPFGTMSGLGLDVFTAVLQATPIDLALLGGTILLSLVIGVFAGAYAGLTPGLVDSVITGVSDLLVGVPPFFLVMVLFLGLLTYMRPFDYLPVFGGLFAAILWPFYARPVRARAQQLAGEPFVEAARAAGAGRGRILWRHVVPNSLSTVLAQIPVDLYSMFFVLTTYPFLSCFGNSSGQGFFNDLTPLPTFPYPDWGFLLAEGVCNGWSPLASLNHWWMYAFPAAVIVVFGIGVTLACDGVGRYLR